MKKLKPKLNANQFLYYKLKPAKYVINIHSILTAISTHLTESGNYVLPYSAVVKIGSGALRKLSNTFISSYIEFACMLNNISTKD